MTSRGVLIVDDEKHVLTSVKRALHKEDYRQFYVENGKQALETLENESIGVVLCDLGMPDMDGKELLKIINEKHPYVTRLIFSGNQDIKDILDAINAGYIFRYIAKPWDNEELKILIKQALYLFDLEQEKKELLTRLEEYNRLLEKKVETRTKQLIAIEKSAEIGKFTAQIVHNLNNPLTAILGFITLSQDLVKGEDPDLEEIIQFLGDAKSNALELNDIISGIMHYIRNEKTFRTEDMDINKMIEKEIKLFEINPLFKNKVKKRLLLDETLPCMKGNPSQIKQVLNNLIKNAIDAMENTVEKMIEIKTKRFNDHIVIIISDTGEGIKEEHIEDIFSPDFTTKPIGKGTGLGLASVKTMVENYHGSIKVESAINAGTKFIIEFPGKPLS